MRAFNYTGSIGDFRYRFLRDKSAETLQVSVYTRWCYEAATDVITRDFPRTDEGVAALQQWLQQMLDTYTATGKLPERTNEEEDA